MICFETGIPAIFSPKSSIFFYWKAGSWVRMLNNSHKRKDKLVSECRHVGCRKREITVLCAYVLGHATKQQRPLPYWRVGYTSTLKFVPSSPLHRRYLATVFPLDFPWTTDCLSWRTHSCGAVVPLKRQVLHFDYDRYYHFYYGYGTFSWYSNALFSWRIV